VKLPHEAIRSKLASENIVDVREEDLIYFKNLVYLDISDNAVYMEQLSNLINLEELDMQYNNLDHLELQPNAFA
jgi:Leucine-rich repeat (LRR) protein